MTTVWKEILLSEDFSLSDVPTPLIFLPPGLARHYNVMIYLQIATTAILTWDILNNLRKELKILLNYRLSMPTCMYFVTRITLLAYCLGRTVLLTTPVGDCAVLQQALNGLLIVAVSCTTFLFYMRVCAVFCMNRYICAVFGTTWLATVAMSGTFPKTFRAGRIDPTDYCLETADMRLLGPTVIVLLANDVMIYLAITYRVYKMFVESTSTLGQRMNHLLLGTSMPVLWKVLLQDSQIYCLIIVFTKTFLLIAITNLDAPFSIMFLVCHLALVHVLSCRVYRNVKLSHGIWEANATSMDFDVGATRRGSIIHRNGGGQLASTGTMDFRPSRSQNYNCNATRRSDIRLDSIHTSSTSVPDGGGLNLNSPNEKQPSIYVDRSHV
ncbi:hypothetical protein CPC08DRAFT_637143 [Agrocybe pediades]|nr:hypothetical protein CPC08DRAFT_637143 [Agrocybe pediades]